MGKSSLAAYRSKRDARSRAPYHQRSTHEPGRGVQPHVGGFSGVKSSQPFGMRRKGGATINWGVFGPSQVHSYDGPKRFVPKPELNEVQAAARKRYYASLPSIEAGTDPVLDHLGFKIVDGDCIFDIAMAIEYRGDPGDMRRNWEYRWNDVRPVVFERRTPKFNNRTRWVLGEGEHVLNLGAIRRVKHHVLSGNLPKWAPVSERVAEHDKLASMVASWMQAGGQITQCKPGKRFSGLPRSGAR